MIRPVTCSGSTASAVDRRGHVVGAQRQRLVDSRFSSPDDPDVRAEHLVAVAGVDLRVFDRADHARRIDRNRAAVREMGVEVFAVELRERGEDAVRNGRGAGLVSTERACSGTYLARDIAPAVRSFLAGALQQRAQASECKIGEKRLGAQIRRFGRRFPAQVGVP